MSVGIAHLSIRLWITREYDCLLAHGSHDSGRSARRLLAGNEVLVIMAIILAIVLFGVLLLVMSMMHD